MAASPNASGPRRPLKGSWEATLQEAHSLAARDDDQAVAHYWRLVDRLARFPADRRRAGQGQLQLYLEEALLAAQAYLAKRGRFNEAQAFFLDQIEMLLDAEALLSWQVNRAKLLSWAGQTAEALDLLQAQVAQWPLDIPARWLLFDLYVEVGRLAEAEALVAELEAAVAAADGGTGDLDLRRALASYLRSALALEQEAWADAFAHFRRAAEQSEAYQDNWHMLYRPLILRRQSEWANRALNREPSEASQRFWRGLSGRYAGDERGAKVEWQQAAAVDIEQVWVRSAVDWILAHYYLGDEQRVGLELALRLLSRPQYEPEPILLVLAALGWALRDDWSSVRVNLDFALARYRENLQDVLLPDLFWHITRDLVGEARFAEFERYFRRPRYLA